MKDFFSQIYRVIVPKFFRKKIRSKKLRASILNYYAKPSSIISDELKAVLNYIENNPLTIFPYPFQNNYKAADIEIFKDEIKGLRYVLLDGKSLYFKRRWSEKRIRHSFNELKKEQDPQSPHRYLSDNFNIENGEILADIGVAEGNFALGAVEKAKALYLFETDKEWIEALNATFEPWKEKVNIINKYVGDKNNSKQTTLDDFFKEGDAITFLKIDVDGAEAKLLKGCERILSQQSSLKVALCTYHKQDDEKEFNSLLSQKGFNISHSDGYMLFYTDKKIKAPYFRRGLIRAVRQ
jgi:molybdopterin converting factor small subunit